MDPISLAVASHASNYMQPGSQHDGNIPQQQQQQQSMDMSGTSSITLSPHRTGDIMNLLDELKAEREALDPAFVHCIRLVDQGEICSNTHCSATVGPRWAQAP